tara:strand:- start:1280 stop:1447 length:168 start_codon:yes stop_codon:yes gene_type:complete
MKTTQESVDELVNALNAWGTTAAEATRVKLVLSKFTDNKIKEHPFAKFFKRNNRS